jgi:hypothetical protein
MVIQLGWARGMSKSELRNWLASLSFSEKIKILERLRDRSRAIAAAGLRSGRAYHSDPEASIKEFKRLSNRGNSGGSRFDRDEIHER